MTDGQLMAIAKHMSRLNWKIHELCMKITEHQKGKEILEALQTNGYDNPSDAEDVVIEYLNHPSKWHKVGCQWVFQPKNSQ